MKEIEKIEKYLLGKMNWHENTDFQQEIDNNPILGERVREFSKTLAIMNKQWLSQSWASAGKKLFWLKTIALVASVVIISGAFWVFNAASNRTAAKNEDKTQHDIAQTPSTLTTDSIVNVTTQPTEIYIPKGTPACRVKQLQAQNETKPTPMVFKSDTNSSNERTTLQGLKDYMAMKHGSFLPNPVTPANFVFSNKQDNIVSSGNGLKVFVPANVFANNEVPYNGKVWMDITYFKTPYDLFCNGISTNSSQGLLKTGGSCFISAKDSIGNSLQLQPSKQIMLNFDSEFDAEMSTFYAQNDKENFDWQQAKNNSTSINDSIFNTLANFNLSPRIPMPTTKVKKNKSRGMFNDMEIGGMESRYYFDVNTRTNEPNAAIAENITTPSLNPVGARYFNDFSTFNRKLAYDMFERKGNDSFEIFYKINSTGILYEYNIKKGVKRKYRRQLKKYLKLRGQAMVTNEKIDGDYLFKMVLKPNRATSQSIAEDAIKERLKNIPDSLKKAFIQQANATNIIASYSLGFINCDRFSNVSTTSCQITSDKTVGFTYLYFPKIQSTLKLDFGQSTNLPINELVHIISFTPTKDGLQMCIEKNKKVQRTMHLSNNFIAVDEWALEDAFLQ